jgi:thioredoxin-like negative regulator of GroEL
LVFVPKKEAEMSQDIKSQQQFRGTLHSSERVCALFYASWCPFSRKFLPDFEDATLANEKEFSSVKIDDLDDLCEEYDIRVFPTVIFFERGSILARLDGEPGAGLRAVQLSGLIEKCSAGKTPR